MSTISSLKSIDNKNDVYRDKDCMKKFLKSLREHAMRIIKWNEIINKRAARLKWKSKICFINKEKRDNRYLNDKNLTKLEIIVIIQDEIEVLRIAFL